MRVSRRAFLAGAALSSASVAIRARGNAQMAGMDHAQHAHAKPERPNPPRMPAIICRVANTMAIDSAFAMLASGGEALPAALHLCTAVEDDPTDHSTGLGALPDAAGDVLLDACCYGPTGPAAAVGSVRGVRNVAQLSGMLVHATGDTVLPGSQAQAFALAHGIRTEDLLTDRTREVYALWQDIQSHPQLLGNAQAAPSSPGDPSRAYRLPASQQDLDLLLHRLEPLAARSGLPPQSTWRAVFDAVTAPVQPMGVAIIDARGKLACAASSAGRPWRKPGGASDIATPGAGCFLDPHVGSVVSSGSAEANLRVHGAQTVVENMRRGMSPQDAGMDALKRIVHAYGSSPASLRFVEMVYYILAADGTYASVSLWQGDKTGHVRQFTIMDAQDVRRTEDCVFLFPCSPLNGCTPSGARNDADG